jgi:hypothetical protein
MRWFVFLSASVLGAACATVPADPPGVVGARLVEHIEAGRLADASAEFDAVAANAHYRERIYPIVYEAARRRYADAEPAQAIALLRFLTERYPQAMAAREALLYAHLVHRGTQVRPDPAALDEIDRLLGELRDSSTPLPIWIELVAAQQAIDRGDLAEARAAVAGFRAGWDGAPAELGLYVEELERYLQAPPQGRDT